MKPLNLKSVKKFVNETIGQFHHSRVSSLEKLSLEELLKKKNPYLFRAKNIFAAGTLVEQLLDAYLSSSEEKLFGDFLEDLAVFVAQQTCDGRKSSATGVDLEFHNDGKHYVASIKSGTNWGNSSQQKKLEEDLKKATAVLKQSKRSGQIEPVLGICYGKTKTSYVRGYLKVVGQNFWYLISENKMLYTEIIEPIGYQAKQHNEQFHKEKCAVINRFTQEFISSYCNPQGKIKWAKLVEFNSGNFDLDTFFESE